MRFAQTETRPPPPPAPAKALKTTLRLATVVYWGLGLALGLSHLRLAGFSEQAWSSTLTVWYAEALMFLAIFGGGALVAGVLTRGSGRTRRPRFADPLKSSTLAGVERGRGH